MEVDLHQGTAQPERSKVVAASKYEPLPNSDMPPFSKFKKFDVRPWLAKGKEPQPEILKRIAGLKPDQGLMILAPFLPSPLIELLGGEGFEFKVEPVPGGPWVVYFWREPQAEGLS
jgi:uncharacterized protein (DUF2249 family)